jgi:hypothetical protein
LEADILGRLRFPLGFKAGKAPNINFASGSGVGCGSDAMMTKARLFITGMAYRRPDDEECIPVILAGPAQVT